MTLKFHPENIIPSGNWIWVFGSNTGGKHARGNARIARVNFRAEFGVGEGATGNAWAIHCYDNHQKSLPLDAIEGQVHAFLQHAAQNPLINFFVTRVGCETGAYTDDQIGPLFERAPDNCSLPDAWRHFVAQARSQPLPPLSPAALNKSGRPTARCPFCGHWTFEDQLQDPIDTCHHEVLPHG